MWQAFPGQPPITKFVAGHYYDIDGRVLAEFKGKRKGKDAARFQTYGKDEYVFFRLATRIGDMGRTFLVRSKESLEQYPIKEVKLQDFPLYITWNTNSLFTEIMKNGKRKTRIFSKSSVIISRRRAYEIKRLTKRGRK